MMFQCNTVEYSHETIQVTMIVIGSRNIVVVCYVTLCCSTLLTCSTYHSSLLTNMFYGLSTSQMHHTVYYSFYLCSLTQAMCAAAVLK